ELRKKGDGSQSWRRLGRRPRRPPAKERSKNSESGRKLKRCERQRKNSFAALKMKLAVMRKLRRAGKRKRPVGSLKSRRIAKPQKKLAFARKKKSVLRPRKNSGVLRPRPSVGLRKSSSVWKRHDAM